MLVAKFGRQDNERNGLRPGRGARRRRGSDGRQILCLAVAACIISVGVGLTSRAAEVVESGYRIGALKAQLQALESENQALEIEVVRLQSLAKIQEAAKTRLNMGPPEEIRVARLDHEWQAAAAQRAEASSQSAAREEPFSVWGLFARIATGARTAQAKPAR
ncbi:MAG: hypothetical protein NUV93_05035 [Firmicutes bacterium]|jgi:cell division protein FtsL|nr:hypothetical protein [Bacillota bacterium]